MIKLTIVSSSLQISLNGSIILVAPKNSCAINVLKLYDAIPQISIYNKYLGNSTSIFNQPLSNCENGGGTPFTIDSFIYFAESNLGFDNFSSGGGSTCNPFEYNTTNIYGIQPCLGNNSTIGTGSTIKGGCLNDVSSPDFQIYDNQYATISGGKSNVISGYYSCFNTIIGGNCNCVENGFFSFIGGGYKNSNSFENSSIIGGGNQNIVSTVNNYNSFILSGCKNINTGVSNNTIGGGYNNISTGGNIINGICNLTDSGGDIVNGSQNKNYSGGGSVIGGGLLNLLQDNVGVINGGENNKIKVCLGGTRNRYSIIGGGKNNYITGGSGYSRGISIGGGISNTVCVAGGGITKPSTIIGGSTNTVLFSELGVIAGGLSNKICPTARLFAPSILGGSSNIICGTTSALSAINGGNANIIVGCFGVVKSGDTNSVRNVFGYAGNGLNNVSCTGISASVMNGCNHIASGACSFILNGIGNRVTTTNSHVLGTAITVSRASAVMVNNISIMNIPTSSVGLPTKAVWNNNGELNIVP